MLIDELVPEGAHGLSTGRDGTGKSFLALDLCMHLVTAQPAWCGPRSCGCVNHGRALYVVGEGVRSFGKRVQGWLQEHGAEAPSGDDLVFRNGTVDLYAGGAE